jgi:hypothetical protein
MRLASCGWLHAAGFILPGLIVGVTTAAFTPGAVLLATLMPAAVMRAPVMPGAGGARVPT